VIVRWVVKSSTYHFSYNLMELHKKRDIIMAPLPFATSRRCEHYGVRGQHRVTNSEVR
jgi:hypothetical protein